MSGKFPPLLLQKDQFIFPTEKVDFTYCVFDNVYETSKVDDERVLKFKEGDSLDLFCHGGSDEYVYYMPEKCHFFH